MRTFALVSLVSLAAVAAGAADGPNVRVVRDVPYLSDGSPKHTLDVYVPEGRRGGPVIVSLYGGGLTAGDKNQQAFVGQRFASAGIVTAVVNYRLTPEVSHPAHARDAAASIAWVKSHAADYGGDPNQLFVIGHSAGAYLTALIATDERYLAAEHLALSSLRGVVPVSAFYWIERPDVAPARDKRIWGADPTKWPDASPAQHLHNHVPPMLILYADGDDGWRRDQNTEAAKALKAAGNTHVEIAQIGGRTHNSIWSRMSEANDEAAERIITFVRASAGSASR
jgi:acetyl esterase/lipase